MIKNVAASLGFYAVLMSAAQAQTCAAVPNTSSETYVNHWQQSGTMEERFRIWMRASSPEQLDRSLANAPNCLSEGSHPYVMFKKIYIHNSDDFIRPTTKGCVALIEAMKCHQAIGWPLSRNPRKIEKPEVAVAVPQPSKAKAEPVPDPAEFDQAKNSGYAALLDLAERRGCLSPTSARDEDCGKILAAAASNVWVKFNCVTDATPEMCQTAFRMNNQLGVSKAFLASYSGVGMPSTTLLDNARAMTNIGNTGSSEPPKREQTRAKCSKEVGASAACTMVARTSDLGSLDGNSLRCSNSHSYSTRAQLCRVSQPSVCDWVSVGPNISNAIVQTYPGDDYRRFIVQQPECLE